MLSIGGRGRKTLRRFRTLPSPLRLLYPQTGATRDLEKGSMLGFQVGADGGPKSIVVRTSLTWDGSKIRRTSETPPNGEENSQPAFCGDDRASHSERSCRVGLRAGQPGKAAPQR